MRNMKISLQLFMLVGAMMAVFAAMTYYQVRSSTAAIYHERYEMLRTQVETALSVLKDYNDRATKGEFSQQDAQKRAYDMLNKMRFEPDGYFFGYDYDVKMIFHPTSPDVGKSNKGKPDANGFAYRDELVRLGQIGGGYVEFLGPKPARTRMTAPIRKPPMPRRSSRGRSLSSPASIPMTCAPKCATRSSRPSALP